MKIIPLIMALTIFCGSVYTLIFDTITEYILTFVFRQIITGVITLF